MRNLLYNLFDRKYFRIMPTPSGKFIIQSKFGKLTLGGWDDVLTYNTSTGYFYTVEHDSIEEAKIAIDEMIQRRDEAEKKWEEQRDFEKGVKPIYYG